MTDVADRTSTATREGYTPGRTHDRQDAPVVAPGRRTLVESIVQRKPGPPDAGRAEPDPAAVRAAAAQGITGRAGPLPHHHTIQTLFGRHDISGIQGHTDDAATAGARAMSAHAFASGNHVAFATAAPSLHTAAHEAAHVVQQRGGIQLAGGVGAASDEHERHADRVADRVVRGESVEHVLDEYAGRPTVHGAGGVQRKPDPPGQPSRRTPFEYTGIAPHEVKAIEEVPLPDVEALPADYSTIQKTPEWRLYDPQDRLVKTAAGLIFDRKDGGLFKGAGYGHYTLQIVFMDWHGAQVLAWDEIEFTILGPGQGDVVKAEPPQGAVHLGSHWTSTVFDPIFAKYGLREVGVDARFGEGLYTTTDEDTGLMAGFSVVQARGGKIREWKVMGDPQAMTMIDQKNISRDHQWGKPPWREDPNLAPYIANYDVIVNPGENEVKFNPRAFSKICLIAGQELDPRDHQQRIQKILQDRMKGGHQRV